MAQTISVLHAFLLRWRRWVVRIWRAFAQHNAAGAAAAPPVLQHAEAAAAAAAVEAEPSIAAALAAARAELLERRNHQSTALSPPNPQELQHPNLHHPQLQHHKMQHQQRGSDEPHDAAAMAANAAAAAKDPKYRHVHFQTYCLMMQLLQVPLLAV